MSFSVTATELIIIIGAALTLLAAVPWLHQRELDLEQRCQHKHEDD